MTVGLIPMSAKPFHNGHFSLIEKASHENDQVIVYVSTVDRKRKGEILITGNIMLNIWKRYLESIMPHNVTIEYSVAPIKDLYEQLGTENERFAAGDEDVATYTIYAGADDINDGFSESSMLKYCGEMWDAGIIDRSTLSRDITGGLSGTMMRGFISTGDKKQFISKLPDPLSLQQREEIWNLINQQ